MTAVIAALVALGLCGWAVAIIMHQFPRKQVQVPAAPGPKGADTAMDLEYYQLMMDTFDRSNILLWWARVTRDDSAYDWKIRTPPKLRDNPIYRLAALVDQGGLWKDDQAPDNETSFVLSLSGAWSSFQGGLWKDDQAPDNERTKLVSATALAEGASGY